MPDDDSDVRDFYANLPGRIVTHRLTAIEVAHDILDGGIDLYGISMLCDFDPPAQRLADGREFADEVIGVNMHGLAERGVDTEFLSESAWVLPEGFFADAHAGDLISVRADDTGWHIEPVGAVAAIPPGMLDAIASFITNADEPVNVVNLLVHLVDSDPNWFAQPLPPLADIIAEADFDTRGTYLAPAGYDWDADAFGRELARIQRTHRLDDEQATAVIGGLVAIEPIQRRVEAAFADIAAHLARTAPDDLDLTSLAISLADPTDEGASDVDALMRRNLLVHLADPQVAQAFEAEVGGQSELGSITLGVFAHEAEAEAPRRSRVALLWLRAKAAEGRGEVLEAERILDAAESVDPTWSPVLRDLAQYASDRGDADRAMSLLRRSGLEDEHFLFAVLEAHLPRGRNDLRRNDPCWCGSGRRFKACHLRHPAPLPIEERTRWLYVKAEMFLRNREWADLYLGLAEIRSEFEDGVLPVVEALDDPLVLDAALVEGGVFEEFLEVRGVLLPNDELLTAQQWLLVERSVFDVEQVHPGEGVTVRDIRTGDRFDVSERTASRTLRVADLICTRVVPVGEQYQFIGGVEPVPLWLRDGLVELLDTGPEAEDVVELLTRRFAPPTLTSNTESEALVMCRARLIADDPASLAAALDEMYEDTPEGWVALQPGPRRTVRAHLTRGDDGVQVETNSVERLDRLIAEVSQAVPSLLVEDREHQTLDQMRAELDDEPATPVQPLDLSDPEIVEMLSQVARNYEQAWLDESIPALGGLTPRQAADDPTRRGELIRLLTSWDRYEGQPGQMSAARLRAALGLD